MDALLSPAQFNDKIRANRPFAEARIADKAKKILIEVQDAALSDARKVVGWTKTCRSFYVTDDDFKQLPRLLAQGIESFKGSSAGVGTCEYPDSKAENTVYVTFQKDEKKDEK